MDPRYALCERKIRAVAAVVVAGDMSQPDAQPLCRRCAEMTPAQRKQLRDQAMTRMLTSDAE